MVQFLDDKDYHFGVLVLGLKPQYGGKLVARLRVLF